MKHGKGEHIMKNASTYIGKYKDDKKHG